MNFWFPREWADSIREERVKAIAPFGFTERQARFLVTVLVHSGVFIERQYRAFARIAHGQNTHDFLRKLVSRGYATAMERASLSRKNRWSTKVRLSGGDAVAVDSGA
jgi:hypothetical protein